MDLSYGTLESTLMGLKEAKARISNLSFSIALSPFERFSGQFLRHYGRGISFPRCAPALFR